MDTKGSAPPGGAEQTVQGHCPACGGRSLFLGDGGYITCANIECPVPSAASDVLADGETRHVVRLDASVFTVRHPLHERIGDRMLGCSLHTYLAGLGGPPRKPGRYRVTPQPAGPSARWDLAVWEAVPHA